MQSKVIITAFVNKSVIFLEACMCVYSYSQVVSFNVNQPSVPVAPPISWWLSAVILIGAAWVFNQWAEPISDCPARHLRWLGLREQLANVPLAVLLCSSRCVNLVNYTKYSRLTVLLIDIERY